MERDDDRQWSRCVAEAEATLRAAHLLVVLKGTGLGLAQLAPAVVEGWIAGRREAFVPRDRDWASARARARAQAPGEAVQTLGRSYAPSTTGATRREDVERHVRRCFERGENDMKPGPEAASTISLPATLAVAGIALALAVGAYILWQRSQRGPPPPPRRPKPPSSDWTAAKALAEDPAVAALMALGPREPARWTIATLAQLGVLDEAHRAALRSLAVAGSAGLALAEIELGTTFDPERMQTAGEESLDHPARWVVGAVDAPGIVLSERTLLPATVRPLSAEGWVLGRLEHPVTERIMAEAEDILGCEVDEWQVDLGFLEASALRSDAIPESDLQVWSQLFVERLAAHYDATGVEPASSWMVKTVGHPGERFDPGRMICADGDVSGPARVVAPVERSGVPQLGLAAPGQPAVLFAVVTVELV